MSSYENLFILLYSFHVKVYFGYADAWNGFLILLLSFNLSFYEALLEETQLEV